MAIGTGLRAIKPFLIVKLFLEKEKILAYIQSLLLFGFILTLNFVWLLALV